MLLFVCLATTLQAQQVKSRSTPLLILLEPVRKDTLQHSTQHNRAIAGNISFIGHADLGEKYVFKLALLSKNKSLKNIRIYSSDLVSDGKMGAISKGFFGYGEDLENLYPSKRPISVLNLRKNEVKTVDGVFEIPKYFSSTKYHGQLKVVADHIAPQTINFELNVSRVLFKAPQAEKK